MMETTQSVRAGHQRRTRCASAVIDRNDVASPPARQLPPSARAGPTVASRGDNPPYITPIYFLVDREDVYSSSMPGQKLLQRDAIGWQPGAVPATDPAIERDTRPIFCRIQIDQLSGRRGVPARDEVFDRAEVHPAI
jgi:hypothetical protein